MADEKKTSEEEKAESKPAESTQEAPKTDEKPPEEKPKVACSLCVARGSPPHMRGKD